MSLFSFTSSIHPTIEIMFTFISSFNRTICKIFHFLLNVPGDGYWVYLFFPYCYNVLCHINYCLCILCMILKWSHDKNNTNIQRNALQVYNYATIYQANKFFSLKISALTYVRILNITLSIVLSKYYASVCSQLLH